mgnify:CR=1 FL=1
MFGLNELKKFLVLAKKATYASGKTSQEVKESNKSKSLYFEYEDFKYHDNYFGGEPYGGREVVFYKNNPVYLMAYYGCVNNLIDDLNLVYNFLRAALSLIPEENPYRGPKEYKRDNMVYVNDFIGDIYDFSGEEKIIKDGIEIYRAKYIGGFINKKV